VALLASLDIGDGPDVWARLGFRVDTGVTRVDGVEHRLGVTGSGITAWSLAGVELGGADVDGLPTTVQDPDWVPAEPLTPRQPNGVVGLDHVVVATPDHARSVAAFEAIGLELRRVRETASYGAPMLQAFFRLGPVILELVGPGEANGDGPARFFGLAWTCADLDATAAVLGAALGAPKAAVQTGRQIATLRRDAGSRVAMAFMSPTRPGAPEDERLA